MMDQAAFACARLPYKHHFFYVLFLHCLFLQSIFYYQSHCRNYQLYQSVLSYSIIIIIIIFLNQKMLSRAVVGGGCFWCIEAVLQRLKGVSKVQSGYAGGKVAKPTYEAVCSGKTGHAEVVRVHYDNKIIPYHDLLYIFMMLHDPTTLNRQGNDVGTQYRSIIMYQTNQEKQVAKKVIQQAQTHYKDKIVTQLTPLTQFFPAEEYHQNYYNQNPTQGYCRAVIKPKVEKLKTLYEKYLEKSSL